MVIGGGGVEQRFVGAAGRAARSGGGGKTGHRGGWRVVGLTGSSAFGLSRQWNTLAPGALGPSGHLDPRGTWAIGPFGSDSFVFYKKLNVVPTSGIYLVEHAPIDLRCKLDWFLR